MSTNEQPEEIIEAEVVEEESAVSGDFANFLNSAANGEAQEVSATIAESETTLPATPLEKRLAKVDKTKELAAEKPEDANFKFREILTEKQRKDLVAGAPRIAERFIGNPNEIMSFGQGTIDKLKQTSRQMLEAQKSVEIPEADAVVNDLLRELDGFQKKYRNAKFDDFGKKILGLFNSAKYSVKTMTREMKPIEDKLDMAEIKLEEMDQKLADNVDRGRLLHKQTLERMNEVVIVLASLEEIVENIRERYRAADAVYQDAVAKGLEHVEFEGETIPVNELQERIAVIAMALSESEKSWHDWRQQFFLGWANAPAMRNLVVTTFALRRRLVVFKNMGIESGRQALVTWKQAAEARQGAEMGNALQSGTNSLIQNAYAQVADTSKMLAEASQAPVITEETVNAVIDSVKQQARSIVAADRNGRALRARNVQALERGEVQIKDEVLAMQSQLAENARKDPGLGAIQSTGGGAKEISGSSDDLLGTLGA